MELDYTRQYSRLFYDVNRYFVSIRMAGERFSVVSALGTGGVWSQLDADTRKKKISAVKRWPRQRQPIRRSTPSSATSTLPRSRFEVHAAGPGQRKRKDGEKTEKRKRKERGREKKEKRKRKRKDREKTEKRTGLKTRHYIKAKEPKKKDGRIRFDYRVDRWVASLVGWLAKKGELKFRPYTTAEKEGGAEPPVRERIGSCKECE
ncbi:MAG TPA: hypothetical protein VKP58_16075 [Candidatus Acidoferrum sp.]|nr:hypothetical protein [Candidatus Acidoferrum sp.]